MGGGDGFLFTEPRWALSLYGGYSLPSAQSDLFDFTTRELTVGRSDFHAGSFGADLAVMLAPRYDLVFSYSSSGSRTRSEFRDWVDNFNNPIEQTTSFSRKPLTASLRYSLVPKGRSIGRYAWIPARLVPYVGVGAGLMQYRFEQAGDFIDTGTLNVFRDRFESRGWAPMVQGTAGASWSLNEAWQFTGELRYLWARGGRADSNGDFVGFAPLDLSGITTHVGFTLRL